MANTLKFGNGEWYGKKDTILAYNDENSNYKPLPFDFSRASKATVINKDGLIETVGSGIPRIDYKDDSKGALKLEPQRTNLVTYSSDFSDASWNKNGGTVSITSEIAPDGTTNSVYNYVGLSSNLFTSTQSIGVEYTISFYVKSNGQGDDNFRLRLGSDFSAALTATSEWVRYSFTATAASSVFSLASEGLENLNLLIWGAQLEQGSYATSYIPTQGSTVTRLADACNNGGNDQVFNSEEGTLYFEGNVLDNDLTYRQISLSETPSGNDVLTLDYSSSSNGIRTYFRVNGTAYSLTYVLTDSTQKVKIAVRYTDTLSLWVNGVQVASTPTPAVSTNFDNLSFDNGSGGGNFYGKTKDVRVYNTALTDAELIALTS